MSTKPANATAEKKGGKKMLLIGGGAALLLAIAVGVGLMLFGGKSKGGGEHGEEGAAAEGEHGEGKAGGKGAPIYFALEPAFTVNLADEGQTRYLQVEVQVMARDQATIDAVELHMPVVRDRLLRLFSQNTVAELRTTAQRDKLQAAALEEVRKIVKEQTGKPGVDALYFTSFVTQ